MSYFRPEIEAMSGYQPGEQPQAGKFIKLNTNENPYPPSEAAVRAMEAVVRGGLSRYPDPMGQAFRRRAAEVLGVEPDWILCGNGSDDILTIVTRAFVGAGQLLRLPHPSYVLYKTLAQIQGARSEEVGFRPDWTLPPEFSAAADDLRLVFLPNPNSPSGTRIPPDEIRQLARDLPCPLLVDEAYGDFARDNCLSLVAENEKVMISRTMSKSYSLAGLRFGFLVAQPHLVEQLIKVKDSYNCDAVAIAGATAAIDDQRWRADNRSRILATRERLTKELRSLGFQVPDSEANFVWCTRPGQSVRALFDRLKASRVLVRYMDYAGWDDGLRITVGTDEQIDALISLLKGMV
jgi:histidinol-phosphate aminotransferase